MKLFLLRTLAILCFFFGALTTKAQYVHGSVPDSLRKYTLLIMGAESGMMHKLFNKRLRQAIETHYDGPYEIVGANELKDPKYSDLSKYRYTVDHVVLDRETRTASTPTGGRTSHTVVTVDLFFFDRITNQKLPNTQVRSASYITSLRNLGLYMKRNLKKV